MGLFAQTKNYAFRVKREDKDETKIKADDDYGSSGGCDVGAVSLRW